MYLSKLYVWNSFSSIPKYAEKSFLQLDRHQRCSVGTMHSFVLMIILRGLSLMRRQFRAVHLRSFTRKEKIHLKPNCEKKIVYSGVPADI